MSNLLKDDYLVELSRDYNVAQFVSFSANADIKVRHRLIRGESSWTDDGVRSAIADLLEVAPSVNVRVFAAEPIKSAPFHYGITDIDQVVRYVEFYAASGLMTIVNETIDVHDGGVSGVALCGIVEFAPDDTPRAVEKQGAVRLPRNFADELIRLVYGFRPDIPDDLDLRIEFSIHPVPVGLRRSHTIIWEREYIEHVELPWTLQWPNAFSKFLGDKAFGLLVAHLLDVPVPQTTVIGRRIAPFQFGRPTGTHETWLRTCPREQAPGAFSTTRKWVDPYKLMHEEDPDGSRISSILSQNGVNAAYSGATLPMADEDRVEGVPGFGDRFMLGQQEAAHLPKAIVDDVATQMDRLKKILGPIRIEWAHDGKFVWILQLHLSTTYTSESMIYPGAPSSWMYFDSSNSLGALHDLIAEAYKVAAGIIVRGSIGVTSHVGDILRKARIPSKIVD